MHIEYYHASKFGNGTKVAEEFKKQMNAKGVTVNIQHVKTVKQKELPIADLYVFSAPGRFGKPIGDMQNFLKKVKLQPGTKYAVIATELCPKPESAIRIPTEDEIGKCQRVLPIMNQILQANSLIKVAENKIFVTGLKGPLEERWQEEVEIFVSKIINQPTENEIPDSYNIPAVIT